MPFAVPESKASIDQNVFTFTIPGDRKTYRLPLMQYLSADFADRMNALAPKIAQARETGENAANPEVLALSSRLQREIFERHVPGLYGKLTADQVGALADAWREASTVGLGESSASAES